MMLSLQIFLLHYTQPNFFLIFGLLYNTTPWFKGRTRDFTVISWMQGRRFQMKKKRELGMENFYSSIIHLPSPMNGFHRKTSILRRLLIKINPQPRLQKGDRQTLRFSFQSCSIGGLSVQNPEEGFIASFSERHQKSRGIPTWNGHCGSANPFIFFRLAQRQVVQIQRQLWTFHPQLDKSCWEKSTRVTPQAQQSLLTLQGAAAVNECKHAPKRT